VSLHTASTVLFLVASPKHPLRAAAATHAERHATASSLDRPTRDSPTNTASPTRPSARATSDVALSVKISVIVVSADTKQSFDVDSRNASVTHEVNASSASFVMVDGPYESDESSPSRRVRGGETPSMRLE
jgi:hypothetical protein